MKYTKKQLKPIPGFYLVDYYLYKMGILTILLEENQTFSDGEYKTEVNYSIKNNYLNPLFYILSLLNIVLFIVVAPIFCLTKAVLIFILFLKNIPWKQFFKEDAGSFIKQ
jgi:hypothetical protein